MFFNFANFYKRFIKSFNKNRAFLILIFKTTALLVQSKLRCTRIDKNEADMEDDGSVGGGKIDDKIANLLNSIKKMSFEVGFFTYKASLAFI